MSLGSSDISISCTRHSCLCMHGTKSSNILRLHQPFNTSANAHEPIKAWDESTRAAPTVYCIYCPSVYCSGKSDIGGSPVVEKQTTKAIEMPCRPPITRHKIPNDSWFIQQHRSVHFTATLAPCAGSSSPVDCRRFLGIFHILRTTRFEILGDLLDLAE